MILDRRMHMNIHNKTDKHTYTGTYIPLGKTDIHVSTGVRVSIGV